MRVETSVVINRPIEVVFTYVSNYENSLDWMAHVVEAETTPKGPVGVGTTFLLVAQLLGP